MKRFVRFGVCVAWMVFASAAASVQTGSAPLGRIADDYWRWQREETLDVASTTGVPPRRLPTVSSKTCDADARHARSLLARLDRIDATTLSVTDRITHDILVWEQRQRIERARYCFLQSPLTPYASSFEAVRQLLVQLPLETRADLARYRDLLRDYVRYVESIDTFVREQARRGIVLPRDELPTVIAGLDAYLTAPDKNPLLVANERLTRFDARTAAGFRAAVAKLIATRVDPATRRLRDYIDGPYRALAPAQVGMHQYPQGKDYYRYLVKFHTTLDITPEAVHERGLAAVAALQAERAVLRRRAGFEDEAAFRQFLRTERRFFAATPAEVEARLSRPVERARAVFAQYFDALPQAPFAFQRLDPAFEGAQTFGYYEPPSRREPRGIYHYNASQLDTRPLTEAASIGLHEGVPGHHLQIALQFENTSLPDFRRNGFATAYVEGWGTYASALGEEMGAYADDDDRYGRLSMDLFMAVRLVVDTGMNWYGWPRERAADYMREHLTLADAQIASETLRYAADLPGQALAYRIGYEEIRRLRDEAQRKAGAAFDIRRFHRCVLGQGAMPLDVLGRYVEQCMGSGEG